MTNPFVQLLAQYAPSFSNDAKYDETIQEALRNLGISKAIEIETEVLKDLSKNFLQTDLPKIKHVILTGTAGDGKTFHSRKVATRVRQSMNKLAPEFEWGKDPVVDIESKTQAGELYTLRIIKDLTELDEQQKQTQIQGLFDALTKQEVHSEQDRPLRYLICANDGKLMASTRPFSTHYQVQYKAIERMLVENISQQKNIDLLMYNLSRSDNRQNFESIVEQVTTNSLWSKCEDCSILKTCPIQINRKRLLRLEDVKRLKESQAKVDDLSSLPSYAEGVFFERLANVLELASYNNEHVPIRHLFVLVANIILGTTMFENSSKKSSVILDCARLETMQKAHKRRNSGLRKTYEFGKPFSYEACSPYENALGLNMNVSTRKNFLVFKLIERFGLGERTTNAINNFLIYSQELDAKEPTFQLYKRYCTTDHYFGIVSAKDMEGESPNVFLQYKDLNENDRDGTKMYLVKETFLDPPEDDADVDLQMHHDMCQQRRRLFFSVPNDEMKIVWSSVWELTHFPSSSDYQTFFRHFQKVKDGGQIIAVLCKNLVKALNRVFTGFYTITDDALFIPTLRDLGRSNVQRYTAGMRSKLHWSLSNTQPQIFQMSEGLIFLTSCIQVSSANNIPRFCITEKIYGEKSEKIYALPLSLDLFQFLMDVEKGFYPKLSSNTLYEDIRDFQTTLAHVFDRFVSYGQSKEFHMIEQDASAQLSIRAYQYTKL